MTKYVVLDTNILREDPGREKAGFKQLLAKISKDQYKLYIPYLVKMEFITYQAAETKKKINNFNNSLKYLEEKLSLKIEQDVLDKISDYKNRINNNFDQWADKNNIIIGEFEEKHSKNVIDDYFSGNPPYKTIKSRKDIIDSFIHHDILSLSITASHTYFISNDSCLQDSLSDVSRLTIFKSIDAFLNSIGQAKLPDKYRCFLISSYRDIEHCVAESIESYLQSYEFFDVSIPSDNHDATIIQVSDVRIFKLNYDEINYYGDGRLTMKCDFTADAQIEFFILKADYGSLSLERKVSVSDWSEHYYDAEDEVSIKGKLIVQIKIDDVEGKIPLYEVKIDSLDHIETIEEQGS